MKTHYIFLLFFSNFIKNVVKICLLPLLTGRSVDATGADNSSLSRKYLFLFLDDHRIVGVQVGKEGKIWGQNKGKVEDEVIVYYCFPLGSLDRV